MLSRFISKPTLTRGAIIFAVIGAVFFSYLVGKQNGRNGLESKNAKKQAEVSQELLVTQQNARQELSELEVELVEKRYTYDQSISNDPETNKWANIEMPQCASDLSAGPVLHHSGNCSMSSRPNTDSSVGNPGRSKDKR